MRAPYGPPILFIVHEFTLVNVQSGVRIHAIQSGFILTYILFTIQKVTVHEFTLVNVKSEVRIHAILAKSQILSDFKTRTTQSFITYMSELICFMRTLFLYHFVRFRL